MIRAIRVSPQTRGLLEKRYGVVIAHAAIRDGQFLIEGAHEGEKYGTMSEALFHRAFVFVDNNADGRDFAEVEYRANVKPASKVPKKNPTLDSIYDDVAETMFERDVEPEDPHFWRAAEQVLAILEEMRHGQISEPKSVERTKEIILLNLEISRLRTQIYG